MGAAEDAERSDVEESMLAEDKRVFLAKVGSTSATRSFMRPAEALVGGLRIQGCQLPGRFQQFGRLIS